MKLYDAFRTFESAAYLLRPVEALGALIVPTAFDLLGCKTLITKAPLYAVERIRALTALGFVKSDTPLIGKDGYAYNGYWTIAHE